MITGRSGFAAAWMAASRTPELDASRSRRSLASTTPFKIAMPKGV